MEHLLNCEKISHTQCLLNGREECGYSGEYTLPEYYPDIAVVLKCIAEPRLQNRQFSGDKLLIDGTVNMRVLYLDEGRCSVHSAEFTVPFSCAMSGCESCDSSPVSLKFSSKYVNARAVSPRRFEVHGAVKVSARAYGNEMDSIVLVPENDELYARCESVALSKLVGSSEKIMTVSEVLEFPSSLPPAEMLLGGTCVAQMKEWKVLPGKVIARGILMIHQLYTEDQDAGSTHCLDFEVPFSQIMDINGVGDGHLCCGEVQVLTDTERCVIGPDGNNTLLEITAKLSLQAYVYESMEMPIVLDAYHTKYPLDLEMKNKEYWAYCGSRKEETVLPILMEMSNNPLQELLDVWLQPNVTETDVDGEVVRITGDMQISVLGRTPEGEITYFEKTETYRLEFPCVGNEVLADVCVQQLNYRVLDGKLEIHARLCVTLEQYKMVECATLMDIHLDRDRPYRQTKAGAILYYAQPGETLWDISRECRTSPALIQKENASLPETLTSACVLLVPIV